MEKVKYPKFVGFQEVRDGCISVLIREPSHKIRLSSDQGVNILTRRIPINTIRGYKLLEDILVDVNLIPLDRGARFTVNELKYQIIRDTFIYDVDYFPEYGIVSTFGRSPYDNPIIVTIQDGQEVYYPHPEIKYQVRRFNSEANS